MYKLDLETLTEDRLRKAVDPETYRLGVNLFNRAPVEVVEISDLSAVCVVRDKRNYHIELNVVRGQITLKCTCPHASRALICEHDVAAWLGLRQHLERSRPAPWQTHLSRVIDTADIAPKPSKAPAYFLFFVLQEDNRGMIPFWGITPYSLALNAIPAEHRRRDDLSQQVVFDLIKTQEKLALSLKKPYYDLDPEACLNAAPEAVDLANLILQQNRVNNFAFGGIFPLERYLRLTQQVGMPLYLGETGRALGQEITFHHRLGELRLDIRRSADGLVLSAALVAPSETPTLQVGSAPEAERVITTNLNDIVIILDEPIWLLAGADLIELGNLPGLSLMEYFLDSSELHIPADQVDSFSERFLLDLARRFPLQGDGVGWEIVQAKPTPRLYLSDQNNELQAQLRFVYADLELRYDPEYPAFNVQRRPESLTLARIQRDVEAEKAAAEMLSSASFGLKRVAQPSQPGLYRLRARVHPVDFLLNSVPRLAAAGFEIYGEEALKTARVNRNKPTIGFKVTSGIDWFDVHAVVNFGDLEVALPEIRRALRKRDRYIKLADGSIGEIPEEWIERYKHLFALGEVEGDNLRFSKHHLGLIDVALEEANRQEADDEFDRKRHRLRSLLNRSDHEFEGITPRELPSGFKGELRHYQKAGYDWLHFLREFGFGGCLADDMGLGKTIQALVFLQSIYRSDHNAAPTSAAPSAEPRVHNVEKLPASLLVVPRSLLVNWQRESQRFTPDLKILEFFDTDRVKDTAVFDDVDLVITTYGVLLRDIQLLHGYTFYYAILDESQAIKNPMSQTARSAHLLRARHKLALTGTPIENSTFEIWSQFAFLNPGLLGPMHYFKTEFGLPIEKRTDPQAAETLRKMVYPFILRRTKDQVAPELPPRTERILYCDMEPAQRKLYNRTRDYFRGMVLGMLDKEGLGESRMKILEGLLRLRQICNHPHLVDEKFHGSSAKFELLVDTLETLRSENHKALVFSQFVKMLTLVRNELDERGAPYTYLDGQTNDRQEQVDRFQNSPDIPFFLISLRAGGLGLNLTAADYVIHIDPWWNPAVEMQASDRTHRIGQEKPVFVYKLIARDSVEEKILTLQERKRTLVDQIITNESAFFKSLTREDIEELFSN